MEKVIKGILLLPIVIPFMILIAVVVSVQISFNGKAIETIKEAYGQT